MKDMAKRMNQRTSRVIIFIVILNCSLSLQQIASPPEYKEPELSSENSIENWIGHIFCNFTTGDDQMDDDLEDDADDFDFDFRRYPSQRINLKVIHDSQADSNIVQKYNINPEILILGALEQMDEGEYACEVVAIKNSLRPALNIATMFNMSFPTNCSCTLHTGDISNWTIIPMPEDTLWVLHEISSKEIICEVTETNHPDFLRNVYRTLMENLQKYKMEPGGLHISTLEQTNEGKVRCNVTNSSIAFIPEKKSFQTTFRMNCSCTLPKGDNFTGTENPEDTDEGQTPEALHAGIQKPLSGNVKAAVGDSEKDAKDIGECAEFCYNDTTCYSSVYGVPNLPATANNCMLNFNKVNISQIMALDESSNWNTFMRPDNASFPQCQNFLHIPDDENITFLSPAPLKTSATADAGVSSCMMLLTTNPEHEVFLRIKLECGNASHCHSTEDILTLYNVKDPTPGSPDRLTVCQTLSTSNETLVVGSGFGGYIIIELQKGSSLSFYEASVESFSAGSKPTHNATELSHLHIYCPLSKKLARLKAPQTKTTTASSDATARATSTPQNKTTAPPSTDDNLKDDDSSADSAKSKQRNKDTGDGIDTKSIAGGVVGGLLAAVAAVPVAVLSYRKWRNRNTVESDNEMVKPVPPASTEMTNTADTEMEP